jgi:hypothetical protein
MARPGHGLVELTGTSSFELLGVKVVAASTAAATSEARGVQPMKRHVAVRTYIRPPVLATTELLHAPPGLESTSRIGPVLGQGGYPTLPGHGAVAAWLTKLDGRAME